jgi:hypothetical protein
MDPKPGRAVVHGVITPEPAQLFTRAIHNCRQIQQLLGRSERETAKEVLNPDRGIIA